MTEPPSGAAENATTAGDTWPWRCLVCGGTIFHDGERCRDCRTIDPNADGACQGPDREGFLGWMRRQSLPMFSLKVTATAIVELSLTSLWLQLFLHHSTEVSRVVSLVGQVT